MSKATVFQQSLHIELLDLWRAGSGRGEGKHLDAVPVTDANGLPYLPGRTVKGLLRDAVWKLETMGALADWPLPSGAMQWTRVLFGSRDGQENSSATAPQTRFNSDPGCVWVSDARLPSALAQSLKSNRSLLSSLYHDVSSTAIDNRTGQALNHTLRSHRVCVPMSLTASVESTHVDAVRILSSALPLITSLGAHRTRGFGRCLWTMGGEQ